MVVSLVFSRWTQLISIIVCARSVAPFGPWVLRRESTGQAWNATVPGEVHMDLWKHGEIGDPYYRFNDREYQWIALANWTYETVLEVDEEARYSSSIVLVLDNVKAVCDVFLGTVHLGTTNNQFRRFEFPMPPHLRKDSLVLSLRFTSLIYAARDEKARCGSAVVQGCPECEENVMFTGVAFPAPRCYVRTEQSTYGWDWGPSFAPVGILAEPKLLMYNATIQEFSVQTYTCAVNNPENAYAAVHRTNCFDVRAEIRVVPETAQVCVTGNWTTKEECANAANGTAVLWLVATDVALWWPVNYGAQPLYAVSAYLPTPNTTITTTITATRHIGFRSLELITHDFTRAHGATFLIVPVPHARFIGCFVDSKRFPAGRDFNSTRCLPFGHMETTCNSGLMTPQLCARMCAGATYFAVQYGSECWCKDDAAVGIYGEAFLEECGTHKCSGNASIACGGNFRNLAYAYDDNAIEPAEPFRVPAAVPAMFVKVNGVPIFARGANVVPADAFQTRETPMVHARTLRSAVEANMNMVRVWGGGLYQTNDFYTQCDRLGLLVWQEMMFACARYPVADDFLANVKHEIAHQVRRLSHHPSIALWSGDNEDGFFYDRHESSGAYEILSWNTILPAIAHADPSRPLWPTSPSSGFASGVTRSGLPVAGKTLRVAGWSGDLHHYNYTACFDTQAIPATQFASEYGYQSLPSFESFATVSKEEDWGLFSTLNEHRQHHPDGNSELAHMLRELFDWTNDTTNVKAAETTFRHTTYLSQLYQAVCTKAKTEYFRRQRDTHAFTMGTLFWQLNVNWQAPSWSSLEYDGTWKLLHYVAKRMYAPVAVSAFSGTLGQGWDSEEGLRVHVANDSPHEAHVQLEVELLTWKDGARMAQWSTSAKIHASSGQVVLHIASDAVTSRCYLESCFAALSVISDSATTRNYFLFTGWSAAKISPRPNLYLRSVAGDNACTFTLSTDTVIPYLFLSMPQPGIWSDNALFALPRTEYVLTFQPFDADSVGMECTPHVEAVMESIALTLMMDG